MEQQRVDENFIQYSIAFRCHISLTNLTDLVSIAFRHTMSPILNLHLIHESNLAVTVSIGLRIHLLAHGWLGVACVAGASRGGVVASGANAATRVSGSVAAGLRAQVKLSLAVSSLVAVLPLRRTSHVS